MCSLWLTFASDQTTATVWTAIYVTTPCSPRPTSPPDSVLEDRMLGFLPPDPGRTARSTALCRCVDDKVLYMKYRTVGAACKPCSSVQDVQLFSIPSSISGEVSVTAEGADQINYDLAVQVRYANGSLSAPYCFPQQSCRQPGTTCVDCAYVNGTSSCPLPTSYAGMQQCSSCYFGVPGISPAPSPAGNGSL